MLRLIGFTCMTCLCWTLLSTGLMASDLPADTIVVRHDRPPKFIHEATPEYPRLAIEGGFSAWVEVKAFVDTTGKIISARTRTNKPNMGFEESAINAAYESELEPARLKKQPVGVWIKYKVTFDPKYGIQRKALTSHNLK